MFPATEGRYLFLVVPCLLFAWMPLAGQHEIGDRVHCSECHVLTERVARIGDVDGPGVISGFPGSVGADRQGRIWVIYYDEPPMVFDQRGAFIQRVGRMGDGPGEFRRPRSMVPVGDSVAIYDQAGRIVVVGPDLSALRSVSMAQVRAWDIVPLDWPRSVLINGAARSPELAGWPLHLLNLAGPHAVLGKSFGVDGGILLPNTPRTNLMRRMAPASSGRAWVLRRSGKYEFARWDGDGEMEERYVRDSEQFPTGFDGGGGGPQIAPSPALIDIRQGSDSLLWVVGIVPRQSWRQAWRDIGVERLPEAPTRVPVSSFPQIYDLYESVVEVIDLTGPAVAWRGSFEGYVTGFLRGPNLVVYRETEGGVPFLEISEVRLARAR